MKQVISIICLFIAASYFPAQACLDLYITVLAAPKTKQTKAPLTLGQIKDLISNNTPDVAIAGEIRERRVRFIVTPAILEELRQLRDVPETINALSSYIGKGLPAESMAQIVRDREKAQNYVKIVKSTLHPKSNEYQQALKLYIDTKAEYEGWIKSVKRAILDDTLGELKNSVPFQQICKSATLAANQFVSYVRELQDTQQSKEVLPILTSLNNIGGKIAGYILEAKKDHYSVTNNQADQTWLSIREKLAADFENEAKWKTWYEISAAK